MGYGLEIGSQELGEKEENFRRERPFKIVDASTLKINFHVRGMGTEFTPEDEQCDAWVLQEAGAGDFPVGKWVSKNANNEEYLLFTKTTVMAVSRWFETYIYEYEYEISSNNLNLTSRTLVPYLPTKAEQAYIDNLKKPEVEAAFRTARSFIPDTSTIDPQPSKVRNTHTVINDPTAVGDSLGIHFNVCDVIDVGFVDDNDVLGEWELYAYINESHETTNEADWEFWMFEGLKFEANGVIQRKYVSQTTWMQEGSWTGRIPETAPSAGDGRPGFWLKDHGGSFKIAEEYEILDEYDSVPGTFLRIQWKDDDDYNRLAWKLYYFIYTPVL